MMINAAPGSVEKMIQSQVAAARAAAGLSPGVKRRGEQPIQISFGQPFDPFNSPPPDEGGGDAPVTNNYYGPPEQTMAPAAATPQRPRAPMVKRMMGSAGGGGLDQFTRLQRRGAGSIPFGGAFAKGGMAPAGKASLVGEEGPEMIIPSGPTQVIPMRPGAIPMRSPMAARPSPQNHSYGGGLAGRAVRPVGRSGYDLNRIAEQQFRRSGNPAMLLQMDWRNRMDANNAPSQPQFGPDEGTPPPTMPTRPGGRLVPGSRPGSSIWVSDPPATMEPPQRPGAAAPGGPPEIPPPASEGLAPPTMPPRGMPGTFGPPQLPWEQPMPAPPTRPGYLGNFLPDPNKGAFDPSAPLPPSPLATYTPPPPMVGSIPIPQTNGRMVLTNGKPTGQTFTESKPDPEPFIPTPEQVSAHNLQPDFSKTTVYNGQHYPTWKSGKPQASTIKVLNDQRQPVDFPAGYELPPGWTELKPKGAGASAPAASAKTGAPVKAASGNSFRPVQ